MRCTKPQTVSKSPQFDRIHALFPRNEPRTLTHREVNLCLKCIRSGPQPSSAVSKLIVASVLKTVNEQAVGSHLMLRVGRALPMLATAHLRSQVERSDWSGLNHRERTGVIAMLRQMKYPESDIVAMLGVSRATVSRSWRAYRRQRRMTVTPASSDK